jgi:transcriptional regulator with XRE-family HTH domain
MSKNYRRSLGPGDGDTSVVTDRMAEFSKRLHYALLRAQMSQSDLARLVWNETRTDSKGFEQVVGRDRISAYVNKKALPSPITLKKIADALDMDVHELAPNLTAAAVEKDDPSLEMKMIEGHPDKVLLRVNQLVPLSVAAKIIAMIDEVVKR